MSAISTSCWRCGGSATTSRASAAIRAASLPSGKPFEPLRAGQGARLGVALLWLGLVLVLLVPLLSLLAASLVPAFGVPISAGTATLRHWGAAFAPGSQTLGALGNSLLLSALAALILALAALPVAALVDQFYGEVQLMGGGRQDTSALVRRLRK